MALKTCTSISFLTPQPSPTQIRTQARDLAYICVSFTQSLWREYWWNNPKRNPRWITYSSYEIFIPIGSSPRSGSSLNRFWSSIFSFVNFYQFSISCSLAPHEALVCLNSAPSGRLETNLGIFNSKLAAKNMFNYFTDITQFICFEFWQRRHY